MGACSRPIERRPPARGATAESWMQIGNGGHECPPYYFLRLRFDAQDDAYAYASSGLCVARTKIGASSRPNS